jgi:thymidylate synthase (FAD)
MPAVDYIDHMGSDLTVANAARVSFDKTSSLDAWGTVKDGDKKLINYLASHNHWTPFGHPSVILRVTAPIFVRTQCFKHKTGFVENEISRRYVDSEPSFHIPDIWRQRAENKKQGSLLIPIESHDEIVEAYDNHLFQCRSLYEFLLERGVAPEQARMVLPQSMMTSWYWTGSLYAYSRFYTLRTTDHAQLETTLIALEVSKIMKELFPHSWEALTKAGQ